ncbi:MAG TPA: aquaporin [Candidatus Saccharimonadales bacterium]|nr:aquaporin [Candidatus Saccharimonadales bacterium]
MFGRQKIAMIIAEFIGTFSLAGAVLAMSGRTSFPFFAALIAGLIYGLMVLVIGSASGAHLNPAVTVGMWTVRKIGTATAVVYIVAQTLGGLASWAFNGYLLDAPLKNMVGHKFVTRVLVAEAVGALIFAFGYASAVYQNYKGLRRAATIGASLTLGILLATFASNGILNPALAIGVRSWGLAYVVGPLVGAVVGVNLYARLFAPAPAVSRAAVRKPAKKPTVKKSSRR